MMSLTVKVLSLGGIFVSVQVVPPPNQPLNNARGQPLQIPTTTTNNIPDTVSSLPRPDSRTPDSPLPSQPPLAPRLPPFSHRSQEQLHRQSRRKEKQGSPAEAEQVWVAIPDRLSPGSQSRGCAQPARAAGRRRGNLRVPAPCSSVRGQVRGHSITASRM